ncbi:hypothetical protein JD488_18210 [Aeromonas jandaei]|uniref:hypothetical protein n=1 Tax=Aeromonas jandaei TaxID=650 RepID=UPI00191DBC16|nr:hypothetical protein [Aeromonas jandaei]MBL0668611.1 hypothetical protein [Aeromonas jandaei]
MDEIIQLGNLYGQASKALLLSANSGQGKRDNKCAYVGVIKPAQQGLWGGVLQDKRGESHIVAHHKVQIWVRCIAGLQHVVMAKVCGLAMVENYFCAADNSAAHKAAANKKGWRQAILLLSSAQVAEQYYAFFR